MIDKLKEYKPQISICFLFVFMLFLHLFRLGDLPYAINMDEAGLWYNVQSLLNYGYDQGGNSWPLLFANFYGEQNAMYTYLALFCVKLFGNTLFALRLPAVLNACLVFIFGAKITKKLFKNNHAVLLYCAFCTIFPYFIVNNRTALDCNMMLGFSTMFIYFLLNAIDKETWQLYLIAGIAGGLVFYTYAISYVTIPLFVAITGIYLLILKKISFKNAIIFLCPIILLGLPLLTIQAINILELNEINILGITLTNFENSRHSDVGFGNILGHIFFLIKYLYVSEEISAVTSSIFCNNFYIQSIPFLLIGLFSILKNKEDNNKKIIIFWLIAATITFFFIKSGIRGYQTNAFMVCYVLCIIEGLCYVFSKLKTLKMKKILAGILIIAYIIGFFGFCYHYFCGEYNDNVYKYENTDESLSNVLETVSDDSKVYFTVLSVYYKLETNKDPKTNPFVYTWFENKEENYVAPRETIYMDGKFIFDYRGDCLNNIDTNATYVIPLKETKMIEQMKQHSDFTMIQIDHYAVFRSK